VAENNQLSPNRVLRFGVFQVNLAARELRKHGVRVRLPGQPFLILSILLERPGEVVMREEIRQRLWSAGTFVDFEHSLNSAIKKLRAALGDSPENSRYIETVPRLGYRFIAPVAEVSEIRPSAGETPLATAGVETAVKVQESRARRWPLFFGISAALVTVITGYFAWPHFRGRLQQNKTAGEIRAEVKDGGPTGSNGRAVSSPKSAETQELYRKGLYFWNKRTVAGFQQAIESFHQATAIDPNYAPAYAGLANSYTLLTAYSSASSTLYIPQARAAALRALELDENLAEAHTALALIVQNHDWDWQTSEREYRRAIELNPNYPTAHHWYAEHLMWMGRFDEALHESERASQLDPLSLIIATDHGAILYYSRQYDRAIEHLRTVLRKDPNFVRAPGIITYAYVEKGMFAQALADAEILRRFYGEGPWHWSLLAYIYGRAGQLERARHELEKLEKLSRHEQVDLVSMLWAHLGMGDKEEALADLEKAYSEHFGILVTLKVEPAYDPLRSDPRFQDLLRRVGLADSATTGKVPTNK
jgi:DNA-binding winged helix-turn-helix (wHTH) protein/Tfp pilus assembly protein PilF